MPHASLSYAAASRPAALVEVAEAVSIATETEREIYVEHIEGVWRWSFAHRGGVHPLLRITARFLDVEHDVIQIAFPNDATRLCGGSVRDPAESAVPTASAILTFDVPGDSRRRGNRGCARWTEGPSRSTVRTMHEHEPGEQRFGGAAQAAEWDARYGEHDGAMWSGRPNGRLVAEVADLAPGRVLDVGCGEGADAIWLASAAGRSLRSTSPMSPSAGRGRPPSWPAPRSSGSAGTPCRRRSRPARSTSCRCRPGAARAAGETAVRTLLDACARAGCCSPSTTTLTTNIAST